MNNPNLHPLLLASIFYSLSLPLHAAAMKKKQIGAPVSMKDVVAVWRFEEGKGNQINDESGNGNNGSFAGGTPMWVDGKFGKALDFNGRNDYVDTNAPVIIDSLDFTMGLWVKPGPKQKKWANILSSHQEPPQRGISIEQHEEELNQFHAPIGDGTKWDGNCTTVVSLKSDEWQHLVIVRKGEGKEINYFLNGKVAAELQGSGLPVKAATAKFRIGNWILGGREFNGAIDEVFLFRRALSTSEINQIMKSGMGIPKTKNKRSNHH